MVDIYTKTVLTIIAVALVAIAARGAIWPAAAQSDLQKVQLCDERDCANLYPILSYINGQPFTSYGLQVVVTAKQ